MANTLNHLPKMSERLQGVLKTLSEKLESDKTEMIIDSTDLIELKYYGLVTYQGNEWLITNMGRHYLK